MSPEERRALFRVMRGAPSDEELAALTVVLAASAGGGGGDVQEARAVERWADPAARLRSPLTPGPGAWQRTFWPR